MKKSIFLIAFAICSLVSLQVNAQLKKEAQVRPTDIELAPNGATTSPTKGQTTKPSDETLTPSKDNPKSATGAVLTPKKPKKGTIKPVKASTNTTTETTQPKPTPRPKSTNGGVVLAPPANDPRTQPKGTNTTVEAEDDHDGKGGEPKCGVPGCTRPGRHEGFHKHEGHEHGKGGHGSHHDDADNHSQKGKGKHKDKKGDD